MVRKNLNYKFIILKEPHSYLSRVLNRVLLITYINQAFVISMEIAQEGQRILLAAI